MLPMRCWRRSVRLMKIYKTYFIGTVSCEESRSRKDQEQTAAFLAAAGKEEQI